MFEKLKSFVFGLVAPTLSRDYLELLNKYSALQADRDNLLMVIAQKVDAEFALFEEGMETFRSKPSPEQIAERVRKDIANGVCEGQQPDGPAPTPSDDPSRQ